MLDAFSSLPFESWVVIFVVITGIVFAVQRLSDPTSLPLIGVLVTTFLWYVGDALYNDYSNKHRVQFTTEVLSDAWWQVVLFLLASIAWVRLLKRTLRVNEASVAYRAFLQGYRWQVLQSQIGVVFWGLVFLWLILATCAVIKLGADSAGFFFPYPFGLVRPWGRGRLGGGLDALLAFAGYLQILVASMFGLLAVLDGHRNRAALAAVGVLLTWPYFLLDRTRNTMLSVVLPSLLALVFIRLRMRPWQAAIVLAVAFLGVDFWFSAVMQYRAGKGHVAEIVLEGQVAETKHLGLNMFEELCWINTFLRNGTYEINYGERYFADIVNPIPRVLWPGKPMIGIDYAIARGQAWSGANAADAGVGATISTGMIGQGVVNFGRIVGPIFAALLMAIWVNFLARLDVEGMRPGRLPLYALGMVLTFNLGRDVTLITLYPILFGYLVVLGLERWYGNRIRTGGGVIQSSAIAARCRQ